MKNELTDCVIKKYVILQTRLEPRSYTSREFIHEIGKFLKKNSKKKEFFNRNSL